MFCLYDNQREETMNVANNIFFRVQLKKDKKVNKAFVIKIKPTLLIKNYLMNDIDLTIT